MHKLGRFFTSLIAASSLALGGLYASNPTAAWADAPITRAQYDMIKNDATKSQVEQVLGPLGSPQWVTSRYVDCHDGSTPPTYYGYRLSTSESEFGDADIMLRFREDQTGGNISAGWNSFISVIYPFCVEHTTTDGAVTGTFIDVEDYIWQDTSRDRITIPSAVVDPSGIWNTIDDAVISRAKRLKTLDLSRVTAIPWVRVGCTGTSGCGNNLTELILGNKPRMHHLDLSGTSVSSLNLTGAPALQSLNLQANRNITKLDLTHQTALTELYAPNNGLSSLNLTQNSRLKRLYAPNNKLVSVALGTNTSLTDVALANNRLTSFSTAGITKLTLLNLEGNRLTHLNLRTNTRLKGMSVGRNNLSKLKLTTNKQLRGLSTEENPHLKKVDCSKLSKLRWVSTSYKLAKKWLPKKLKNVKARKFGKRHYVYLP